VAIDPGVTVAVSVLKEGWVVDPGAAESTSNCKGFEVPPPGAALSTVMVVIPAAAMTDAGTCAVSWVSLPYCVERAVAFQNIVEPDVNPEPDMVSVKAAPPSEVNAGDMLLNAGTGFVGALMV
jgi:hypothetical protein